MNQDPSNSEFVSLAEKAKVFQSLEKIFSCDDHVVHEQVEEDVNGAPIYGEVVDLEAAKGGALDASGISRVVIVRSEPHEKLGIDKPEQTFVAAYGRLGNKNEVHQFVIDVDDEGYPSIVTREENEHFIAGSIGEKPSISRKDADVLEALLAATESELSPTTFDIEDIVPKEVLEYERLNTQSSKHVRELILHAEGTQVQNIDVSEESFEQITEQPSPVMYLPIVGTEDGLLSAGVASVGVTYMLPSKSYSIDTFNIVVQKTDGSEVNYEHMIFPDRQRPVWNIVNDNDESEHESLQDMIMLLKQNEDELAGITENMAESPTRPLSYEEMSELESIISLACFDAGVELYPRDDDE